MTMLHFEREACLAGASNISWSQRVSTKIRRMSCFKRITWARPENSVSNVEGRVAEALQPLSGSAGTESVHHGKVTSCSRDSCESIGNLHSGIYYVSRKGSIGVMFIGRRSTKSVQRTHEKTLVPQFVDT